MADRGYVGSARFFGYPSRHVRVLSAQKYISPRQPRGNQQLASRSIRHSADFDLLCAATVPVVVHTTYSKDRYPQQSKLRSRQDVYLSSSSAHSIVSFSQVYLSLDRVF